MYRVAVALVTAVLAGTSACGGEASSGTPTVGLVVASQGATFADEMSLGFAAGVDGVGGVRHLVTGPPIVDGPKQVEMFADLRKKATAGIAVETLTPELFARPLADAVKDGARVMTVDTPPDATARVGLYIGNDNYALGASLADVIIQRLPVTATGTVILGTSVPGVPVLDSRAKGMSDRFAAKRPGVTVLGPFDTSQDVPANLDAWNSLVTANPAALAFLGTGEADAYDLASIRRRTAGLWLAGAFDLNPKSLTALRQGELVALASPEHYLKGMVAGRIQAQHARDDKALPSGWIVTPGAVVTPTNVAEYEERQASATAKQAWAKPRVAAVFRDLGAHTRPLAEAR